MHRTLMTALAVFVLAAGYGAEAAAASSCPEARGACQPIGERSGGQKPQGKAVTRLIVPKAESGGELWRARNHVMY